MDSRVHVKLQISLKESKEIVTQVTVTDKNPFHDFLRRRINVVGPMVLRFYGMLKISAEYDRYFVG
jgi:hypothetical protein